jgi:cell division septation protein DedD
MTDPRPDTDEGMIKKLRAEYVDNGFTGVLKLARALLAPAIAAEARRAALREVADKLRPMLDGDRSEGWRNAMTVAWNLVCMRHDATPAPPPPAPKVSVEGCKAPTWCGTNCMKIGPGMDSKLGVDYVRGWGVELYCSVGCRDKAHPKLRGYPGDFRGFYRDRCELPGCACPDHGGANPIAARPAPAAPPRACAPRATATPATWPGSASSPAAPHPPRPTGAETHTTYATTSTAPAWAPT